MKYIFVFAEEKYGIYNFTVTNGFLVLTSYIAVIAKAFVFVKIFSCMIVSN